MDQKDTLYNKVAVFLDSKNGLDWHLKECPLPEGISSLTNGGGDNQIKQENYPNAGALATFFPSVTTPKTNSLASNIALKNYRFSLENYLSPVNPLTQAPLTYIKNDLKKIEFNSRTIFFSRDDIIIPFLNENEWKKFYNQSKTSQENPSDYTVNVISLPVSQISLPIAKYNYGRLNYALNSTLDYLYSPQFFITNAERYSQKFDIYKSSAFVNVNRGSVMRPLS